MESVFCIVCLKRKGLSSSTFSGGGGRGHGGEDKPNIFWKFARDYLQFSTVGQDHDAFIDDEHYIGDRVSELLDGDGDVKIKKSFCTDCAKVINSICQLYLELLGVQLRLSWKLGELGKLFESCNVAVSSSSSSLSSSKQLDQVREQLITKCAQKAQEYSPRIINSPDSAPDSVLPVPEIKTEPNADFMFYQPEEIPDVKISEENDQDDDDGVGSGIEDSYHPSSDEELPQAEKDSDSDWSSGDNDYSKNSKQSSTKKRKKRRPNSQTIKKNSKPVIKEEDAINKEEDSVSKDEASSTSAPWDCELCGPTTTSLTLHLSWHEKKIEKKEHQCYFCYKTFALRQSLNRHVKVGHSKKLSKERQFRCPEKNCSVQNFETVLQLNEHLAQTHSNGDTIPLCSLCGLGCLDENLLKLHELLHIRPIKKLNNHSKLKNRVVCPECGKDLTNWVHLQSHYNIYHGACLKTYQCSQCKTSCTSSLALRSHRIKYHSDSGALQYNKKIALQQEKLKGPPQFCNECGKELKNKLRLEEHFRRVHKEVKCQLCGEITKGFIALQEHRIKKHNFRDYTNGKEGETFECTICSKMMPSRPRLLSHMSDYHSQEKFECEICKKVYKGRIQLRSHMKKAHNSEDIKQEICPHCGKTLADSKSLGTHIGNVHPEFLVADGGRANSHGHECPHCKEKFRMKYALDRHLLRGHPDKEVGEGLIECKVCGMRMLKKKQSYMDYHMETHLTVEERRRQGKLHMCHVCGKEFRTRKAYKGHVKAHDEDEAK
ncbi:unnamed protein product [Orchesella dallaii]|uniref:C2H2-type domain-containing protein n=1 Tax=Orchesella dallaii TaxID=48710 RepID=A0ABP1R6K5_9HEXA